MITHMSHATINVLDIDKAYDFYVTKLGFKVATDFTMDNGFRWLTLHAPQDPKLEITLYIPMPGSMSEEGLAARKYLLENNLMGAGVLDCDDCQATYEDMKAKGVEFLQPPIKQFYGTEALFRDGCGNWFSKSERPKA